MRRRHRLLEPPEAPPDRGHDRLREHGGGSGGGLYGSRSHTDASRDPELDHRRQLAGSRRRHRRRDLTAWTPPRRRTASISTIIADNSATEGPDLRAEKSARPASASHRLAGRKHLRRDDHRRGNNITGTDPLLGPLADNGGPTETMLPARPRRRSTPGSPTASRPTSAACHAPSTPRSRTSTAPTAPTSARSSCRPTRSCPIAPTPRR